MKASVANSIVDRVKAYGGLSVKMLTGEEPTGGYMVARREFSKIIKAEEFFNAKKGKQALATYLKQYREQLTGDCYFGLWHDTKNNEVVFDVVDNIADREQAIQAGRERNQQAIWDVTGQSEINTGGTGDRESSDVSVETTKAVVRDDGSRDRIVRFRDVGRVLSPKQTVEFEVIKRSFASRSEAGRYAAEQRWKGHANLSDTLPLNGNMAYIRGIGTIRRVGSDWVDRNGVPLAPSVTRNMRISRTVQEAEQKGEHRPVFNADEVIQRTVEGQKSEIPAGRLHEVLDKMADRTDDPNILNITVDQEGRDFGRHTLGLRRNQMPQIPSKYKAQFLADLEARGVKIERGELWASGLMPTQKEISGRAAGKLMRNFDQGKDKFADQWDEGAIIASKDRYVMDGHHRWAAQVARDYAGKPNSRIRTITIMLNHDELINVMRSWNQAHGIVAMEFGQDRVVKDMMKFAHFCKAVDLALMEDVA